MIRKLIYLLLFAFNFVTSQTKVIDPIISEQTSIIRKIAENSHAGISLKSKDSKKIYQGYRLCEDQYLDVQKLGNILQIENAKNLYKSSNGALKTVAFIILAKVNNEKNNIMQMIDFFLTSDYIVMTKNCSDAIQIISLPEFCYRLVTEPNLFFKPNFKLTKKEKKAFEVKLKDYKLKLIQN